MFLIPHKQKDTKMSINKKGGIPERNIPFASCYPVWNFKTHGMKMLKHTE
jgi:hypothetical protein